MKVYEKFGKIDDHQDEQDKKLDELSPGGGGNNDELAA